jgi:hypothetical protein
MIFQITPTKRAFDEREREGTKRKKEEYYISTQRKSIINQ